ncbi:MAG: enoyl-CoA hydratase [Acidobacteria bacterium]|nr:MAG: enoyl-CoA hydratase [Acidobacteriota bacterium]
MSQPEPKPATTATSTSPEGHLIEEHSGGVVTLTMNRPESLNALSGEMMEGLREAVSRLSHDPAVRVVVLTGAGNAFCAGGDVKGMAQGSMSSADTSLEERAAGLRRGMEVSKQIHQMPKPVIAKMRGAAAGAGLSLALACDLRLVSENAVFTTAFARVGFSGDYGGSYFLPQLVGQTRARELYLTARKFDAKEALAIGMVNQVLPDDQLDAATEQLAGELASGPAVAYRYMKRNLNATAAGADIDTVFDLEAWNMTRTGMTEDHREAARAFVEKRRPVFKGR